MGECDELSTWCLMVCDPPLMHKFSCRGVHALWDTSGVCWGGGRVQCLNLVCVVLCGRGVGWFAVVCVCVREAECWEGAIGCFRTTCPG